MLKYIQSIKLFISYQFEHIQLHTHDKRLNSCVLTFCGILESQQHQKNNRKYPNITQNITKQPNPFNVSIRIFNAIVAIKLKIAGWMYLDYGLVNYEYECLGLKYDTQI